jgi:hypothetical protein
MAGKHSTPAFVFDKKAAGAQCRQAQHKLARGLRYLLTRKTKDIGNKKEKDYFYAERSYGSFRRDLTLGSDVDASRVDAVYKNGVLTINLTKSERAKAIKVKVKGQ